MIIRYIIEAAKVHKKMRRSVPLGNNSRLPHEFFASAVRFHSRGVPVQGIIRLESVQPRRIAAPEHLYQDGLVEMAQRQ